MENTSVSPNGGQAEILFEKFEVVECIKKDLFSAVYVAKHIFLGKKIILKTLNTDELPDKTILGRFKREAKILAHLDHPNLIKVLDFGTYKNHFYLSFEYFESRNLRAIIKFNNLSVNDKTHLLIQLLKALDVAHGNGIIHRDIKPENILVNSNLELKIADFGLAIIKNETALTQKASIVGTPSYMSPEQIRGEELTPQTDLFSAGIIAYELFTNKNPFVGKDITQTINNILGFDESSLDKNMDEVPHSIKTVIKTMLKKNYRFRAKSAGEILNKLGVEEEIQYTISNEIRKRRKRKLAYVLVPTLIICLAAALYLFSFNKSGHNGLLNNANNSDPTVVNNQNKKSGTSNSSSKLPPKTEEKTQTASKQPGKFFVECLPWADVYVDGKKIDQTPLKSAINLSPGYHSIKLIHPNYPPYKKRVKIHSEKTDSMSVNFNNIVGFLDFNVNPWGYVYVDNDLKGSTPLKEPVALLPGKYKLTISNPTFGKIDTVVDVVSKSKMSIYHNFLSSKSVF